MTFNAYGDSITTGSAASGGNGYVARLAAGLGVSISNLGVSGHQAANTAILTHKTVLTAADKATLLIGTNDQWKYGTNATKQAFYLAFLTDVMVALAAPSRGTITYTGSWTVSQPTWATGKWSYTPNNTATATVSGTAVYVGVILQEGMSSSAEVRVDGNLVGTVSSNGTGMTTQNGQAYAPGTFRFGGLSAGSHAVEVKVTTSSGAGPLYVEHITGSDQVTKPSVYLSTIPRYTAAAYAAVGGSDANMAFFNGMVTTLQGQMTAEGLNVALVDSAAAVNQTTHLSGDGLHPNDAGHGALFDCCMAVVNGGLVLVPAPTYAGNDGNFYIGDGAARKRVVVQ